MRRRIRAANVATDNAARRVQLSQRPIKIGNGESTALPVRHRFFPAQTVEIDCDVDIFASEAFRKFFKAQAPIVAKNCASPLSIFRRAIVSPRMHFQNPGALRAAVSKDLVGPPALEISAAPNCHVLDVRQL